MIALGDSYFSAIDWPRLTRTLQITNPGYTIHVYGDEEVEEFLEVNMIHDSYIYALLYYYFYVFSSVIYLVLSVFFLSRSIFLLLWDFTKATTCAIFSGNLIS